MGIQTRVTMSPDIDTSSTDGMCCVLTGGHDPFWDSDDAPPAGVVGTGENGEIKKFKRQTRLNWSGASVMLLYFGILCFYLYIRVAKTLDLGQYFWYGIIVLVVEIMGASTTLLYGVNLLLHPVYQPVPKDESGKPMVTLAYHVRVLVPCYKESLEILARTCSAALEAVLPEGCTRSVYLCDDGGDATKRKWVQSKAAEKGCNIYYVSGRKRSPGEMNGKSANLNNCLKMLYPGDRAVPPNELVCIFDADQVANKDFYTKTLPLFDAGDDVGMVLSPQAFYNLNQRADIFNHSNIHFWEYAQHGYDAIGFISCTGEPPSPPPPPPPPVPFACLSTLETSYMCLDIVVSIAVISACMCFLPDCSQSYVARDRIETCDQAVHAVWASQMKQQQTLLYKCTPSHGQANPMNPTRVCIECRLLPSACWHSGSCEDRLNPSDPVQC